MSTQNELFDLPVPDTEDGKVCVKCNVRQPEDNFSVANGGIYRRTECKSCMRKAKSTIKALREQYPYPEDPTYECPICRKTSEDINRATYSPFVLDHCHDTGDFRGWICDPCNRGLGAFGDDAERLKKAIDYLLGKT